MMMNHQKPEGKILSIKFLVTNSLAGSIIGTGGNAIRELVTETNAKVIVSGPSDTYPGTSERIVLVTGTFEQVSFAQTLIWEMIAIATKNAGKDRKSEDWSPKLALMSHGENEEVQVTGKISIPSASAGIVIGKSGSTISRITEEAGVRVQMSNKDESLFTQERILTVSGKNSQCVKFTDLILLKINEQDEIPKFFNKGTVYRSPINSSLGQFGNKPPVRSVHPNVTKPEDASIPAETTISLSIANDIIGNIFGKNVSFNFIDIYYYILISLLIFLFFPFLILFMM